MDKKVNIWNIMEFVLKLIYLLVVEVVYSETNARYSSDVYAKFIDKAIKDNIEDLLSLFRRHLKKGVDIEEIDTVIRGIVDNAIEILEEYEKSY